MLLKQVLAADNLLKGLSNRDFLKFIDPPAFVEEYDRMKWLRDQGTGGWLFRDEKYVQWRQEGQHEYAILWVKGPK